MNKDEIKMKYDLEKMRLEHKYKTQILPFFSILIAGITIFISIREQVVQALESVISSLVGINLIILTKIIPLNDINKIGVFLQLFYLFAICFIFLFILFRWLKKIEKSFDVEFKRFESRVMTLIYEIKMNDKYGKTSGKQK